MKNDPRLTWWLIHTESVRAELWELQSRVYYQRFGLLPQGMKLVGGPAWHRFITRIAADAATQ